MPGLTNETALLFNRLEYILTEVTEATGTLSFDETNAAEQTLTTLTIAERTVVNGFILDMSNCTQDITFRLYTEVDGTNMREFQENQWRTTFDDGVVIPGAVFNEDVRITLQCDGGGAGSVDVPYTVL